MRAIFKISDLTQGLQSPLSFAIYQHGLVLFRHNILAMLA